MPVSTLRFELSDENITYNQTAISKTNRHYSAFLKNIKMLFKTIQPVQSDHG